MVDEKMEPRRLYCRVFKLILLIPHQNRIRRMFQHGSIVLKKYEHLFEYSFINYDFD